MTLGRNAVGYLTESMHGAGSPQAQRIQIYRYMQLEFKQQLAQRLAGIDLSETVHNGLNELVDSYFARVFETAVNGTQASPEQRRRMNTDER
jgi:4-hydroxybutyryl-CoA dehydratase/vinylacetyl-CoA-Delta-isomerase